jgi:hypothetical protein
MASGRPLAILPDDVAEKLAGNMWDDRQIAFHFAAMKRILERDEPDYTD